jgi:hypothetical protein
MLVTDDTIYTGRRLKMSRKYMEDTKMNTGMRRGLLGNFGDYPRAEVERIAL